jgi:hypothetical protein
MTMLRPVPVLLLACGLARAEDLTPYTIQEVDNLLHTFSETYKEKVEDDAVSVLGNLKKAYLYLTRERPEGSEPMTKEEEKAAERIIDMIAKKGLFVKDRTQVSTECAKILGDVRAEEATKELKRFLEKTLDEKSPQPYHVEFGFLSLAHIGPDDKTARELVLKYATTGRHTDISVASQALRACYEWRELDGKDRKEFFEKIVQYLGGLWSQSKGGDAKTRGTYETRYNAVKDNGLKALGELAGDKKFADPVEAQAWWNENKKRRWEIYYGPEERKRQAAPAEKPKEEPKKEEEGKEPEGGEPKEPKEGGEQPEGAS